uniref:Uncharacterized protein n=1 Tax=Arundo donax TaxID=35708 RepID=A0A0A8ZE66_ARUDO
MILSVALASGDYVAKNFIEMTPKIL